MKTALLALTLTTALAAAGCGSSNSSSSSTDSGGVVSTNAKSAPAATSGGGNAVQIKNFAFSPSAKTVKVGQKITWTNEDSIGHNVVAKAGANFASKTLNKGDSFSFTPTKAGTISYVCTFHPNMKATLTVTG